MQIRTDYGFDVPFYFFSSNLIKFFFFGTCDYTFNTAVMTHQAVIYFTPLPNRPMRSKVSGCGAAVAFFRGCMEAFGASS